MDGLDTPKSFTLCWGDLHKHVTGPGTRPKDIGRKISDARTHLDFCAVYCYPFVHHEQGEGLTIERVGDRSQLREWWDAVQEQSRAHNDPGEFVTFPAYEWHGNRRRWGDHHVVYFQEGYPLDGTADVRKLSENLTDRRAVLIPHHTGYYPGERGKDWDSFDPSLSPVMEIYSSHGSSEAIDSPVAMTFNGDMGPRTSGGTFHDAVLRGHRVGILASNDGPGVPGAWNRGVAAVWATDLTREAIWEAITARRTYGSTGDRIALWWTLEGEPMGGIVTDNGELEATVSIDCPRPLDRIEILRNDQVVETHTFRDHVPPRALPGVYRLLVEFGWGPTSSHGEMDDVTVDWTGDVAVTEGDLCSVVPRFVGDGQSYDFDGDRCGFSLRTSRDETPAELPEATNQSNRQGLLLEVDADVETVLTIEFEDRDSITIPLEDAVDRAHLFAFYEEASAAIADAFDVSENELGNLDRRYHLAPKVRVHRAEPRAVCQAEVTSRVDTDPNDCVYVRASQTDGQYVWGSPVWVQD